MNHNTNQHNLHNIFISQAVRDMLEHKGWGPKDLNKFRSWQDFKLKMEQIRQLKNRNWFMDKLGLLVDR